MPQICERFTALLLQPQPLFQKRLSVPLRLLELFLQRRQFLRIFLKHMLAAILAQRPVTDRACVRFAAGQQGPAAFQILDGCFHIFDRLIRLLDEHPQFGKTLLSGLFRHFQRLQRLDLFSQPIPLSLSGGDDGQTLFQIAQLFPALIDLYVQSRQPDPVLSLLPLQRCQRVDLILQSIDLLGQFGDILACGLSLIELALFQCQLRLQLGSRPLHLIAQSIFLILERMQLGQHLIPVRDRILGLLPRRQLPGDCLLPLDPGL